MMETAPTIVIVDDDPNTRKTLSDILSKEGYSPISVSGGDQASLVIEEIQPQITLIDLQLKGQSGLDVMKQIKRLSPDTACIVLTGYTSQETAIEAINLGAYSYLEKPYNVSNLLLTIRRAIEKHEAEKSLHWEATVNATLAELSKTLIDPSPSIEKIAEIIINYAKRLTNSEHGFISYLDPLSNENISHNPTQIVKEQHTPTNNKQVFTSPLDMDEFYPALWMRAINSGEAVFTNSPVPELATITTLEGRIVLRNFMVAPVLIDGKPVAVITLSNSSSGYSDRDNDVLTRFVDLYSIALQNKQYEKDLEKQSYFSQVFLDSIPCTALLIRPGTREIVASNKEAVKADAVPGKTCYETWAKRESPCPWCLAPEACASGEPQHLVVEALDILWDAYWIPLEDDLYLHYAFDITARKKAADALSESEQKYHQLFNSVSDAIMLFDAETRKFIDVNQRALDLYGYPREEFLELVQSDISAEPIACDLSIEETISGNRENVPLRFHRKKDGTIFPAEISSSLFTHQSREVLGGVVRDISDRVRAEEELRNLYKRLMDEKKKLEDVVKGIGAGLSLLNSKARIIWANDVLQEWFGPLVDFIGKPCYQLYGIKKPDCSALKTLKSGQIERSEVIAYDTHGNKKYFRLTTAPITNQDGDIDQIVELTEDITEQKLATGQIQQQADDLKLINSLNEAANRGATSKEIVDLISHETKRIFSGYGATLYYISDDREFLVMQNLPLSSKIAKSIQKILGMNLPLIKIPLEGHSLFHHVIETGEPQLVDDVEAISKLWADIVETTVLPSGESRKEVFKLLPKLKKLLNIKSMMIVPLLSKQDAIGIMTISSKGLLIESDLNRFIGITEQMTAVINRMRTEEALYESELRLRTVAKTAADSIVLADSDGKILFWNAAAEKTFGYLEDEVLGEPLTLLMPERYVDKHKSAFAEFRSSGTENIIGRTVELAGLRKNGEEFPIVLSLASWMSGGDLYFSAVIRDITKELEAQDHLLKGERMAAVGQLAAGVAHDFNNILVPITLYTQMLILELDETSPGRDRLMTILKQARRASSLTEQLLDFSRKGMMALKPLDMVSFLHDFIELIKRTISESIQIELSNEDEIIFIDADTTRMQQVFMNLALNARDAMPNGGHLRFELSQLFISADETPPYHELSQGEWLRISVSDNGTGIHPDQLPHIFEPFFTTKEPGMGTGLGLAQVYGIVRQHNGFIDVQSHVDEGTTFVIYLPAMSVREASLKAPVSMTPTKGSQQTILIVEDNDHAREAMQEILSKLQYRVMVATNGHEGLEIFNRESIDLVLSDLVMPEMGGMKLYEAIREKKPDAKMILLTGYPLNEDMKRKIEAEDVTCYQKPFDVEKLSNIVFQALRISE